MRAKARAKCVLPGGKYVYGRVQDTDTAEMQLPYAAEEGLSRCPRDRNI